MDNKIGKKLNAVWEELRKLPDLFTQLFERQKKLEDKLADNQKSFEQAVDKFAVIVADSNNGEKSVVGTVNIENLYEEIDKALKENASEPFSLDYKELEKLFDKNTPRESIKLENVQELAQELKKILPKSPDQLFIKDKKIEVFGKALVKIDGNAANNPLFVQLSDGKSPIDLKEIFNVKVAVNGGGGGSGTSFKDTTGKLVYVELTADGSIPVTVKNSLTPNVDFDYIDIQQTSATVETYVYKQGGVSGTTVQTITVTYTDSTKNDLDKVEYS